MVNVLMFSKPFLGDLFVEYWVCPGVNQKPLLVPKPGRILLGFHTPDHKKLASKVTKSKFKTEIEEKVQNNNVELEFY